MAPGVLLNDPTLHDWLRELAGLSPEERDARLFRMEQVDPELGKRIRAELALGGGVRDASTLMPGGAPETAFFEEEPRVAVVEDTTFFGEEEPVADVNATTFPGADPNETTFPGADENATTFPGAGEEGTTEAYPPPAARRSGEWIGRYRILGKLGEGGMGVVYEAEQERPRRKVAIKVIRATAAHMRRRFEWEAEVLARLDHPGIARILEAHADPERSWFAMEFVSGAPLDEAAAGWPLDDKLRLLADIADAVHHAHLKGVVHRDLKPGNILVAGDGQPKVLDFGIARAMDEDDQPKHTRVGQIIGTPQYMSPEQATVGQGGIDGRSDVYALGVIAFELIAGQPPYDVRNKPLPELVRIITEQEAPPLTRLNRDLPSDVAVIVAKCLEKDAGLRYQSAWDLAEDLRRMLRDEPILARPATATYQLRKFAKRNRGLTASILTVALVVVLALVVSTVLWRRAQRAAERAEAARHALQLQADRLLVAQARNELAHDPTRAVAWLDKLGPEAAWDEAYALIHDASALGVARHVLRGHVDEVRWSDVSDDGRTLVTAGYDDTVRLWDLETGEGRILGEHGDDVKFVAFGHDGRVWSASRDRTARIWDPSTGEFIALEGHGSRIEGATLHPTEPWFVTASDDGSVWMWDDQGSPIKRFDGHGGPVEAVTFSPDGRILATAGSTGRVGLWDFVTGEGQWVEVHEDDIRSMTFSADGRYLASASRDGTVGVVTVEGLAVRRYAGHAHEVRRVGWVGERALVSGARDGELLLWDLDSGSFTPFGQV
ncbi:MAG: hypothetical protein EP330_24980, partial [Deltaproteobacteria bacterium]